MPAEVGPRIPLALEYDDAIARNLEAQQRWRSVHVNQINDAPGRTLQRNTQECGQFRARISQDPNVEIARFASGLPRRRPEHNRQRHARRALNQFANRRNGYAIA
ncbi:MAG: hypothetical protein WCP29_18240 [Acidobacteriota bacterium]